MRKYLARIGLPGYSQEEVFFSLYAAAQLKESLGLFEQEVIAAYLEAAGALPTRAEALHGANRSCRTKGRHEEGFQVARQGLAIGRPSDRTHIGSWIYEYGLQVTTDGHGYQAPDSTSVHTRNILLRLSDDLDIQSVAEILPPAEMPEPACKLVLGFQDLRLFTRRGELWGSACLRELRAEGWCQQVLARIDELGPAVYHGNSECFEANYPPVSAFLPISASFIQ